MISSRRILLVSAHPDDMEIGMGGTAVKMVAVGNELISVVMTDGRRSPDPDSIGQEKMAELRKNESDSAIRKLGIERSEYFGLRSLTSVEECHEALTKLMELIVRFEPNEIYTLHPGLDRHPSHRAAGRITVDSVEQLDKSIPVWAYEVWGLFAEWDRFEDISDQMATKLAAINEHRSQIASVPYADGVSGLNRWRAVFADPHQTESTVKYAEVFVRLK